MKMEFVTFLEDLVTSPPPTSPPLLLIFCCYSIVTGKCTESDFFLSEWREEVHVTKSVSMLCPQLEKRFFTRHLWGCLWVCGAPKIMCKMLYSGIWECVCGKTFPSFHRWLRGDCGPKNVTNFPLQCLSCYLSTRAEVWLQVKGVFGSRCRVGIVLFVIVSNKHAAFKCFNTNNAFKENFTVSMSLLSIFADLKSQ